MVYAYYESSRYVYSLEFETVKLDYVDINENKFISSLILIKNN